jgi:hypothetical protein
VRGARLTVSCAPRTSLRNRSLRFNEPNARRINPRRRLLDRSSPKLSQRTQTTPGPDLGCHHLHHQVVDFPEGHLIIIDRVRSPFRPFGVIRTYSQGELLYTPRYLSSLKIFIFSPPSWPLFFYTFALDLTASDLVRFGVSLADT